MISIGEAVRDTLLLAASLSFTKNNSLLVLFVFRLITQIRHIHVCPFLCVLSPLLKNNVQINSHPFHIFTYIYIFLITFAQLKHTIETKVSSCFVALLMPTYKLQVQCY
jgi:hypothetical protein